MAWGKNKRTLVSKPSEHIPHEAANIDWDHLVTLDFETYFDDDYTLRKQSTSEYVRDPRFKAQMVALTIGRGKTKWYNHEDLKAAILAIDWTTHDVLCHHTQFDGFILAEWFGVMPRYYYCTLSMARGLHSNDIGAGLNDVAEFYGKGSKLDGILGKTKGVRDWPVALQKEVGGYNVQDNDLCLAIFKEMVVHFPQEELDLINQICRMFCHPVVELDEELAKEALRDELIKKRDMLLGFLGDVAYVNQLMKTTKPTIKQMEQGFHTAEEVLLEEGRKVIAGNESFAQLLRDQGIDPPMKISPAYLKKRIAREEVDESKKFAYAFAQTDLEFMDLQNDPSPVVRDLVELRLAVKSTINETRAGRLLILGQKGRRMPVYYKYYGAHTGRLSGGDRMNFQNLERGGKLRRSIKAQKKHVLIVADSGQIEARVNGWLWNQLDLLEAFRKSDAFIAKWSHLPEKDRPIARGEDRDAYCRFGDRIYGREITILDKDERFVAKTAVLGLGYGMGHIKFHRALALGGRFFEVAMVNTIVITYRAANRKIVAGWDICNDIIEDMATGNSGSHKCISWEKGKIWLPNGMCLKYPGLKKNVDGEWQFMRKGHPIKIYGSLLTENIVQALARIIVTTQTMNVAKLLEKYQLKAKAKEVYALVMSTHDEMVAHAPARHAEIIETQMTQEMRTAPEWCADLPLNVESGHAVEYSK